MGALLTGLLVPYLGSFIPANEASVEVYQVMTQFSTAEVTPQAYVEEVTPFFTWMNLLWAVYILGGIVVLSRFLFGLNRIYCIYKEADKTQQTNYTLVESDKYHLPFSFFHFIFISKQLPLNDEVEKVLRHEELHANQWHSIDIVFTELLQIFFWFNPILIMYKGALRQSHEYLADAYVTQDHNKNSYGQLLLQQSTSGLEIALANQFFHSQIKKRITMMYKEKSKRSAMVKYLAAVPVLVAMLIIFSSNQKGATYSKEELSTEFSTLYQSVSSDYSLDNMIKWDNLLNKYANNENIKTVSADFKEVANEFGIFLSVSEKTSTQQYTFSPFIYAVPPGKIDQYRSDQDVRDTYQEVLIDLSHSFDGLVDFDIRVEENGIYTFPPTDKRHDNIREYFKAIKAENRSVIIKVNLEADSRHITSLLDCAQDLHLEVILNDVFQNAKKEIQIDANKLGATYPFIDPEVIKSGVKGYRTMTVLANGAYIHGKTPITDQEVVQIISLIKEKEGQLYIKAIKGSKWGRISNLMNIASQLGVKSVVENQNIPENFNGRKIIQRNWIEIVKHLNKADGKVVIKAEANAAGKMVYVEIDSELSTITDRDILKNVLSAAKRYKIEKGEGTANGTLIFNLSKNGTSKNYHDEYINQYNYGQSNENKSMLDHINDFTKENQGDPIFKIVEEMPRFPGCEDMDGTAKEKEECAKQKMLEFIYSNLMYPEKARDASVEGMCVVQFVIEKDGSVTGAKLVRDIGADCGLETMKVINNFPIWIPGKQKGKTVRVQYTLPVKFKLEGDAPQEKETIEEKVVVVGFGEPNHISKKENLYIKKTEEIQNDIFKVVQEMPRFSGCEDMKGTVKEKEECAKNKMLEYVYRNIKYPKEARTKGIDGMSVIRMVIEKDGSVTNVSTLRDPGAGTGPEAARVVRKMPNWVPGKQNGELVRVQYTLPVKFKLEGEDKPSNIEKLLKGKTAGVSITGEGDRNIRLKTSNYNGPDPLFVINGKIKESASVESLDPDNIESMNVLKGEKAKEKYGKDAVNGVVEITTKQKKIDKKYTYKTSLKYTADQFKKVKDIAYLLKDIGLKAESKSKVLKFSLVRVPEKDDAHVAKSADGKFNQSVLSLISEAKITDRYFFEEIVLIVDGREENIGTVSIMIVDGMPSLVKSLTVVNGKIVGSYWMKNINPEDIEKIDVLKGDKMIEKYGDIPHNSVVEITLKPGKKLTKYLIDGQLFGYDFFRTIDKSHINKERPATKEEKFMRGMKEDLIIVNMLAGYGFNSAYFPETNTVDGSDQALLAFVGQNIKYPKSAIDNNIEGVVTVRYTVEANGDLTNFSIGKSIGWGLDQAVLDMMEKLAEEKGAWKAAYLNRSPIATSMVLPVKFKLQSGQKKEAKSRKLNPIKFSIGPNPSDGNFNVEYQLDKNIPVNLTFYSSAGKTIKRMLKLPAENKISVDLSNQNTSVIYVSLEQDGKAKTIKASVQK